MMGLGPIGKEKMKNPSVKYKNITILHEIKEPSKGDTKIQSTASNI